LLFFISLFLFQEKGQATNAAADIASGMVSLMGPFFALVAN
jgi:hypothetical protein